MPLRQRRRCEADDIYTHGQVRTRCIARSSLSTQILMSNNAHIRPPLRTSGRKNKQSRAINERLETAQWRTCPSPAVLTTAHHRMGVASSTRSDVCSVFLHLFSSSPSRQQQALYLAVITQSGAGMLHAGVSRHAHHADDQTTRSMPKTDGRARWVMMHQTTTAA